MTRKRFPRGLVVGKFCPLHLGHESVIRRALEDCGEVLVLSYTRPEFTGCEPARRRAWLHARFPTARVLVLEDTLDFSIPANDADDQTHRRFVGRVCRERLGLTVDAVFTSETYGPGFAEELTTFFRETEPSHPAVQHVFVDATRQTWPISGTALRADVHTHRHFLAPEVYASFIERVALLGGESSGKSTLATALAAHFDTMHVAEYGRELWEAQGGHLERDDLPRIAQTQLARETDVSLRAHRYLFCDSTPLTTLFYMWEMFGDVSPALEADAATPYDHTILCAPDFGFVQDGTRRDAAFRQRQHEWYVAELDRRGIAYHLARGSISERIDSITRHLSGAAARA